MDTTGVEPAAQDVGWRASELVHDGRIVRLSVDDVCFPDGSEGRLEMIRHRGASAVLPVLGRLTDEDPEVALVRQYRYAAGGFIYEVPAGMPDGADEGWDACARRELEEETGLRAGRLIPLTRIFTTPGFTDEVIHLFVALELEEGTGELDDDEFLDVVRMPFSEALDGVRTGRIVDGKSVSTILYADRFVIGSGQG